MSKPLPVYALVGPDPFLQLLRLSEILRDLPKDAQRVDADGERAELGDVLDELRSFAMFGGRKLAVVRDADEFVTRFREPLEDYVAAPSDSATLVLRLASLPTNHPNYNAIYKVGRIEDCPSAEFRAVTWLGMWLEDVRAALRGAAGKVAWKYKERFPQFLRTSRQLGQAGADRALDLLAEADHQSKTGVGDAATNVERFILELGAAELSGT